MVTCPAVLVTDLPDDQWRAIMDAPPDTVDYDAEPLAKGPGYDPAQNPPAHNAQPSPGPS